jgi:hypothetical protein
MCVGQGGERGRVVLALGLFKFPRLSHGGCSPVVHWSQATHFEFLVPSPGLVLW